MKYFKSRWFYYPLYIITWYIMYKITGFEYCVIAMLSFLLAENNFNQTK